MDIRVNEYGDFFERHALSELMVEEEGLKLMMKRGGVCQTRIVDEPLNPAPIREVKAGDRTVEIKAPLLGVYHSVENVKVGDKISKGMVLCNIEAMKMYNEVVASTSGILKASYCNDKELVEYDQVLFEIEEE